MNKQELLDIFTKEQRIEPINKGWRREETDYVVRHVAEHNDYGFVVYSRLTEENAAMVIDQELSYFKSISQPFEWKLYDYDQPKNLRQLLQEKGFEIEEPEALLVLEINKQPSLLELSIPAEIVPITDEKGIDAIVQLEDKIWGYSHASLAERLKRDLQDDPEHIQIYAAIVDDKVVSAAWMYLHEGTSFGSLWGGSTLPEYRGKGYYTALLAIRARAAIEKGYSLLTVDASPMSAPILKKKGFELLAYSYPCNSPR